MSIRNCGYCLQSVKLLIWFVFQQQFMVRISSSGDNALQTVTLESKLDAEQWHRLQGLSVGGGVKSVSHLRNFCIPLYEKWCILLHSGIVFCQSTVTGSTPRTEKNGTDNTSGINFKNI